MPGMGEKTSQSLAHQAHQASFFFSSLALFVTVIFFRVRREQEMGCLLGSSREKHFKRFIFSRRVRVLYQVAGLRPECVPIYLTVND